MPDSVGDAPRGAVPLAAAIGALRDELTRAWWDGRDRKSIQDSLANHGLGHLPAELPANQEREVRLYQLGTPIADTINAVLSPSGEGDQVLRQNAGSEAQEVLKRVRELVCE